MQIMALLSGNYMKKVTDFAIDLVKAIANQVSMEAESEFNNKYNIDKNEYLYDQLIAKNLFICGCESVRIEVQGRLVLGKRFLCWIKKFQSRTM